MSRAPIDNTFKWFALLTTAGILVGLVWTIALSRPAPGDAAARPALCSELETAPVHGWQRKRCIHCGKYYTLRLRTTVEVEGEE